MHPAVALTPEQKYWSEARLDIEMPEGDTWENAVVTLSWEGPSVRRSYELFHCGTPTLGSANNLIVTAYSSLSQDDVCPEAGHPHTSLSDSYVAVFKRGHHEKEDFDELESAEIGGYDKFVLKLPKLVGADKGDLFWVASQSFHPEVRTYQRATREARSQLTKIYKEQFLTSTKDVRIPYIAREYIDGLSLRHTMQILYSCDIGESSSYERGRRFAGIPEISLWFEWVEWLIKSLEPLHKERIVHGFICPDTIIVPTVYLQLLLLGKRPKDIYLDEVSRDEMAEDDKSVPQTTQRSLRLINTAGSQQHICLSKEVQQKIDAKTPNSFSIRRWYDWHDNAYFPTGKTFSGLHLYERRPGGTEYHSVTDLYSLGITFSFLAHGHTKFGGSVKLSPWENGEAIDDQYQAIPIQGRRAKYSDAWGKLLKRLDEAANARAGKEWLKVPDLLAKYLESEEGSYYVKDHRNGPATTDSSKKADHCLRQLEVILICVRTNDWKRVRGLYHLRTQCDIFKPDFSVPSTPWGGLRKFTAGPEPRALVAKMSAALSSGVGMSPIEMIMSSQWRTSSYLGGLASEQNWAYTWQEDRSSLADLFLSSLSALRRGDTVIALTTSSIWTDEGFGSTGRIATMIRLLRINGIRVTWIIVMRETEPINHEVSMIWGRRGSDNRYNEELLKMAETDLESDLDGYRYVLLPDREFDEIARYKQQFIAFLQADTSPTDLSKIGTWPAGTVLVAPDLMRRKGQLAGLTYWTSPEREDILETFKKQLNNSELIFEGQPN